MGGIKLEAFEFGALYFLDGEDFLFFERQRFMDVTDIPAEFSHAFRFEGGGVVGAFPGPVKGKVAFNPGGAQGHGGDVRRDAEVVAGESDGFDPVAELFLKPCDFEETDIVKCDRVSGGATVEDDPLRGVAFLKKPDDLFLLLLTGHSQRKMKFSGVFGAKKLQHRKAQVAGGRNFDEFGIEGCNFPGGGQIPDGGAVTDTVFLAPCFELAVLVDIKFKVFAVFSVGVAVAVPRIGVGGVELLFGEQFTVAALLEFDDIRFTVIGGNMDHFLGDIEITSMIAAYFGNDTWGRGGYVHIDYLYKN